MFRFMQENPMIARMRTTERRRNAGRTPLLGFARRQAVPLTVATVCFGLALLGSIFWGSENDLSTCAAGSLLVTCLIVAMLAPFRSLGCTFAALTSEREAGTYDSLLGTRLSSEEIAAGKLYVGTWPLLRELTLIAPFVVVFGYFNHSSVQSLAYLLCVTTFVIFFGCLGLYCSALSKDSQKASRLGTLVACLLVFAPVIINALFHSLGDGGVLLMLLSPLASTTVVGLTAPMALTGTGLVAGLYGAAAMVLFSETVRALRGRPTSA